MLGYGGSNSQRDALQFSLLAPHLTKSCRDRSLHSNLKNGLEKLEKILDGKTQTNKIQVFYCVKTKKKSIHFGIYFISLGSFFSIFGCTGTQHRTEWHPRATGARRHRFLICLNRTTELSKLGNTPEVLLGISEVMGYKQRLLSPVKFYHFISSSDILNKKQSNID